MVLSLVMIRIELFVQLHNIAKHSTFGGCAKIKKLCNIIKGVLCVLKKCSQTSDKRLKQVYDEDFGSSEGTGYPFQSQKAGTYTITVSGEPYKCYLAVYIVDYATENIRGDRGYYTEEGKSLTIKV